MVEEGDDEMNWRKKKSFFFLRVTLGHLLSPKTTVTQSWGTEHNSKLSSWNLPVLPLGDIGSGFIQDSFKCSSLFQSFLACLIYLKNTSGDRVTFVLNPSSLSTGTALPSSK